MTLISPVEDQQLELENIRPTHLTCSACKKSLPIEQFYNQKKHPANYGKKYECKTCSLRKVNQWRIENPYNVALGDAKKSSKKRDSVPKEFNIDVDYLKQIDTDICPILGIPMQWNIGNHHGQGKGRAIATSKSLDRIDSSRGYVKGNVIIISWRANRLKNNATLEELITLGKWAETNL